MSFEVGPGIPESDLPALQEQLRAEYGTRSNGGVNFRHAPLVPVTLCAVQYQDSLLLVQRNPDLTFAGGKWSFISEYLDQPRSVAWHAQQGLLDEAGIQVDESEINVHESYTLTNSEQPRDHIVWIAHVLLDKQPVPVLKREELVDSALVYPSSFSDYDILSDLHYAGAVALGRVRPGTWSIPN